MTELALEAISIGLLVVIAVGIIGWVATMIRRNR